MIIIIYGNIGVGKSTLAKVLAAKLKFHLIQFDPLVPSVTGKENMYEADGSFVLSDDDIERVHAAMRNNAKKFLESKENVIVESMYFKKQREQIIALAETMGVLYYLIEVLCDEEEVKKRIQKRLKENSQSAGMPLFLETRGQLNDETREHIRLDTTGKSVQQCVNEVVENINF